MKGILFSQMEPPVELEAQFNDWYKTEHIPVRLALPGFRRAVRYIAREGKRKYLAIYEIDDLAVLQSPGYQVLKSAPSERTALMLRSVSGFTRYTCSQINDSGGGPGDGSYLSVVASEVPREQEAMVDDWYANEHVPLCLRATGWQRLRRYKVLSADGGPWTQIALHDVAALDMLGGAENAAAYGGPQGRKLAGEPWFLRAGRWLYEVHSIHEAA